MGKEKRKAKRLDLNVKMKLTTIDGYEYRLPVEDVFEVDVINVSKDGIAFRSSQLLLLNTFYNAEVVLWTMERFNSIIEIVRMENNGGEDTLYGCRFIGIASSDQFKIDVYQIVNDMD